MSTSLLAEFEDQITELRGRLPKLTGNFRRDAAAELESLTEFLDLLAMLREPGGGDGAAARDPERTGREPDAIPSAKQRRQEM